MSRLRLDDDDDDDDVDDVADGDAPSHVLGSVSLGDRVWSVAISDNDRLVVDGGGGCSSSSSSSSSSFVCVSITVS